MDAITHDIHRTMTRGAEIRAKIEANRQKRLDIAQSMKAEAGVAEHEVWHENFGGLAWIDTGKIQSPEGRKIAQLHIVAHECGHIFLHGAGKPGRHLPSHVMEWEAESYAHQCFIEHGMRMPKRITTAGRRYVGHWIAKDRAAGVPIDPRAQAYAIGRLSPYEPLREVPATWRTFKAQSAPWALRLRRWFGKSSAGAGRDRSLGREMGSLARSLWSWFVRGALLSCFALPFGGAGFMSAQFGATLDVGDPGLRELFVASTGGVLLANVALVLRTLRT